MQNFVGKTKCIAGYMKVANLACCIINILNVLLCSIAENFYKLFVF